MKHKVKKITGATYKDKRGTVQFINEFNFKGVKRFYQIENANPRIIRAFHGHMKEAKYIYVASGAILLCAVFLDNVKSPSKENKIERFVLKASNPQVIHIPPSYANGFKTLESDTKVIFFSTSTLKESIDDDFRFPPNYWGEEVWESD